MSRINKSPVLTPSDLVATSDATNPDQQGITDTPPRLPRHPEYPAGLRRWNSLPCNFKMETTLHDIAADRQSLAPHVARRNELLEHGEIPVVANRVQSMQEASRRLHLLTSLPQTHEERTGLLDQLERSSLAGKINEHTYVSYADAVMRVSQRHENQIQDTSVFSMMASRVHYLHADQMLEGFNTILDRTHDPVVLSILATQVHHLQADQMLGIFEVILARTQSPAVLGMLVSGLPFLQGGQRLGGFNAILNRTQDTAVLRNLAGRIHSLPEVNREQAVLDIDQRRAELTQT